MAGKSFLFQQQVLDYFFLGTAIPYVPSNTYWYVSLHSGDPDDESGNPTSAQTYLEVSYGDYARVAVLRSTGFTRSGNIVYPAAAVTFPTASSGLVTATHFAIGAAASGAGQFFYSGPLASSIPIATSGTPILSTSTFVSES